MSAKKLYSKHFPHNDQISTDDSIPVAACDKNFIQNLYEKSVYVVKPEHIWQKNDFIRLALSCSDSYELDIDIYEHIDAITVDLFLVNNYYGSYFKNTLSKLLALSDYFFLRPCEKENGSILSLVYHTHDHYINGKKMRQE